MLLLAAAVLPAPALAGPARFANELAAIAERDRANPMPQGGVLFLGSSSIRLWNLGAGFPSAQAVNHGFGGATVTDVLENYELLVGGHRPDSIVVYVGENDLAQGRAAAAVAHDVGLLLARLRTDFPTARIAYLSIKYAPVRWSRRNEIARANALIGAQTRARGAPRFDFIDASQDLLVSGEQPDANCYGRDGLHLNESGYARWNRIVRSYLARSDRAGREGAGIAMAGARKR